MIDFVRGILTYQEAEYVVVDVGGIGYRVWCPNPYASSFVEGKEITLYIHYHVREDAHLLFGFPTREEQRMFRRLLDVSGIGPKVALGVLSGANPEALAAAIHSENLSFLTKLPGIGKKTAQRMILDLKDKLGAFSVGSAAAALTLDAGSGGAEGHLSTALAETREALLALGYSESEADRALAEIRIKCSDSDSVDVMMRLALQALYKQ